MEDLKSGKIKEGTVIDHIAAGKALNALAALGLSTSKNIISILMNVDSSKLGKKDIIKIEGLELDPNEVKAKIFSLAPDATVNLIRNFEVVKKAKLSEL